MMQRLIKWICYIGIGYVLVLIFVGVFAFLGLTSVVSPKIAAPVIFAVVFIATPGIYKWIRSKLP